MRRFNDFTRRSVSASALVLVLTMLSAANSFAQTTAFTYQGRFTDSSANPPAGGNYTMTFRLYDNDGTNPPNPDTPIASQAPMLVTVTNGIFTTRIDFGAAAFNTTQPRFLEIQVGNTILTPRQQITSSPFANRAVNAASADSLSNACVGCVTSGQIASLDAAKINGTVSSATTATTAGNVSGVVAVANGGTGSATQNFVDLTTNQTVGGNKTFTGVLSGDASGLRNINGANVAGSTTLNPQRLAILRWYDVNQATLTQEIPTVGDTISALAFDGTFVYVTNTQNGSISRIRAATGIIEGSPIVAGSFPIALVFDGTFVYAANYLSNTVSRIRAATGVVEGSPITVGNRPLAFAFDGTFVYVANQFSDTVSRIRASTGAVEGNPIAVGNKPQGLAFDGTFVYVTNYGSSTVSRIRASTGAVEGSPIAVGSQPNGLVFDGTFIYVANSTSSGTVSRIRAATGIIEGSPIAVGNFPIAFAFDGTFVYVGNFGSSTVSRIRASTGAVEGSPLTVSQPHALAFDGTFIYVAVYGGGVRRF